MGEAKSHYPGTDGKARNDTSDQPDPCAQMDVPNMAEEEWQEFLQSKSKDLPDLGPQICVSAAESLTEPEAEYQAEVIKRVYAQHVVLQFNIQQTIESQLICDVYVELDYDDTDVRNLTCPVIKCNGNSGITLAIIERGDLEEDDEVFYVLGMHECQLRFKVKNDSENA